MKDLIERQMAIDELMVRDKELRNINWYDKPYAEGECRGIDEALAIVSNLPSVQPQYEELTPEEAASEIASGSIMSAHYWLDAMIRLKQMGYAICRKR